MPTPKKTPVRRSRTTRTKTELAHDFDSLQTSLEDGEDLTPEARVAAAARASEVRSTVKGLSVDNIAAAGAKFTVDVGRTITALTEQCVEKANELKALEEAVALESAELEKLYNLEVAAASVKALIEEHETKKKAFEESIANIRKAWQEEDAAHTKAVAARNAETEMARRREQDEYAYRTRVERRQAEDAFQQEMQTRQRAFDDKLALAEKDLAQRVDAIAKQESDILQMRTRIENIESEIKAKVDRDVAIATSSLKKDLTNTFALEKKDLEARLQLEMAKSEALNQANAKLATQVELLTKQVEAAKAQVTEVTIKALESASGQVALATAKDIVKDAPNGNGRGGKA